MSADRIEDRGPAAERPPERAAAPSRGFAEASAAFLGPGSRAVPATPVTPAVPDRVPEARVPETRADRRPAREQDPAGARVAVIIPCHNEETPIGRVVEDFRAALPEAEIYVYDNNSTDRTVEVARAAGATVRTEPQQGKGYVVRRMFSDVDADLYVLVDGDDTYEAAAAPRMLELASARSLDMVNGCRVTDSAGAYRPGHRLGNRVLTGLVASIFGRRTRDMLSGYRVFSRRFVKSFPALSRGFEIETEFTVHALELRMPIADVDTAYSDRPAGSASKLSTFRDGARILRMIVALVREERPLPFFGAIGGVLAFLSLVLGWPVVAEFAATGLVPRLPTAVLAAAVMILAALSVLAGLILDTVTHGRREMKRLFYLSHPAPGPTAGPVPAPALGPGPGGRERGP